ncbi:hypothetical protein SAMN05421760_109135 [Neptunomonas antarctica]|uniref:Uncharacterized protein n=1 Tax=Neptunomonas antarctica TaxID=619304 RepID=A0A1N7NHI4_9GAMM|nr:hypothetical protein SAMN05421760_109135 [Neptunomonas antarctica]
MAKLGEIYLKFHDFSFVIKQDCRQSVIFYAYLALFNYKNRCYGEFQ